MKAKYDCAGNIIVLLDNLSNKTDDEFDQLIKFEIVSDKNVSVNIFNRDGSKAKNCLNGLRALMNLLSLKYEIFGPTEFSQDNILLAVGITVKNQSEISIKHPAIEPGGTKSIDHVTLGNEHLVNWIIGDVVKIPSNYIPKLNEEYVYQMTDNILKTRVFESGVGETGSCGSGAVAVGVSAFNRYGLTESVIDYPGGKLQVKICGDLVSLRGPTQLISCTD
ncbi:hypothetical protein IT413_03135 [Candidatus Peregrinibacteria bacterium]|nr:hypothetical protein [Candidatus Peregrinibacteria bacterium]